MRRVYMYFMLREGWHCQFLEPDLRTPLRRKLTFRDDSKIREMFDRFAANHQSEDKQMLEYAIEQGRGSIWLNLTDEQYRILKR